MMADMEGKPSIWDPLSPGVLIVDPAADAYEALRVSLSSAGVTVHVATTIPDAFILFGRHAPSAVIIRVEGTGEEAGGSIKSLPETGGSRGRAWQDVALAIRDHSAVPVLVICSADHAVISTGILRPNIDEVHRPPYPTPDQSYVLRSLVQASRLTRRAEPRLTVGKLTLDAEAFTLSAGDQRIPITVREFEVMRLLMSRPGQVVSLEDITAAVWGDASGTPRTSVIKVHIGRLRKKLPATVALTTVRARGYVLDAAP
ncbi:winged helix-turn-helix transcriptional regulator [Arthrobacter antioxidans]|uniref:winged helix-turn-helix transcriptional regulator n=1 Tax=Arthrobacter antioxidans TaxID=2895818 RepID=UPI001FFF31B3|nr:winged-helix domain-containing protein [Arthrobacter antioxidans]